MPVAVYLRPGSLVRLPTRLMVLPKLMEVSFEVIGWFVVKYHGTL